MKKRIFLIILFSVYFNISLNAKERLHLPAYIYDSIAVDAKAIAMGEAFSAVSDNVSAIYWNPGGITQVKTESITIFQKLSEKTAASDSDLFANNPLEGKKLRFIGVVAGELALSFKPLTRYSGMYRNKQIELTADKFSIVMSEKYTEEMTMGISLSYIPSQINMVDASIPSANISGGNGFSLGAGFLYKAGNFSKIGFSVQNIPGYIWWKDYKRQQLKTHLRTGISSAPAKWLLFSADYENLRSAKKEYYHAGLQQTVAGNLFFRQGITSADLFREADKKSYSCGIGYEIKKFTIDTSAKTYKLGNTDNDKVEEYTVSITIPSNALSSKLKK